jgi:Flp pilus assembly protein protease CpaA
MTFPALHLLPLGLCLIAATVWDVARRRIPNGVVAIAALSGLVVQIVDRGLLAAASGLGAAVIVIALLYRPWTAGGIGGGDVKLAAAAAIWVGLAGMVRYALGVAVAGGLVAAIAYLLSTRSVKREVRTNLTLAMVDQSLPPVSPRAPGRVSVPYGLAISAGAIVALWGS